MAKPKSVYEDFTPQEIEDRAHVISRQLSTMINPNMLGRLEPAFTLWLTPDTAERVEKAARSFRLETEEYLTYMIEQQVRHKNA